MGTFIVTVDGDKCEGCEECVNNCPVGVFQMKDTKADPYQADLCEGCETCVSVCPSGSMTLKEQ
ncbi:MAG: 4Fe-4S dicluster domain-containing protein [Nitrospirota bacterium]